MGTILTLHGRQRMHQRGLSAQDLAFVRAHGRVEYRTGVKFIFLGRRDIPAPLRKSHGHLEGVTLIVGADAEQVITCYRNREAIAEIKRKGKRDARTKRRYA